MRKLKAIIVSLLTAWGVYAADITPITNALKSGDAAALAGNMYTETDIAVPGAAQKGSPAEAGAILSRFFQGNTPSGFTVVHQADKNDGGREDGNVRARLSGQHHVHRQGRAGADPNHSHRVNEKCGASNEKHSPPLQPAGEALLCPAMAHFRIAP